MVATERRRGRRGPCSGAPPGTQCTVRYYRVASARAGSLQAFNAARVFIVLQGTPGFETAFDLHLIVFFALSLSRVVAGNLAYAVTDESLRYTLESALSDGAGTVADVRIAVNKETGLKRGFAYVVRVTQSCTFFVPSCPVIRV